MSPSSTAFEVCCGIGPQASCSCTLIDGELVIADEDGYADFSALQARLSEARAHVSRIARQRAAVLVVFDVLDIAGRGLMDLADASHPCLQLIEQTADFRLARDWLTLLPIEGVVPSVPLGGTGRGDDAIGLRSSAIEPPTASS